MSARRPMPRRHPLASPRGRWRAAHRLAAGLPAAAVARAEQVDPADVEALLARPDFRELVASCRALAALPEAERLRRLEQIAWCALELAMAEGDWRCAAFVLTQRRLGRNPARTPAQLVVKAQAHAATAAPPAAPKPTEPTPPPRAPRRYDPAEAVVRRAAVRLRDAVAAEAVVAHELVPPAAEPAAAPAPRPAALPRRPDGGLAARLRDGTAVRLPEPDAASPRGLLRAWAQGP